MGQQRIRKKRRRRIRKPNVPIVILASITIVLVFVWAGLYWKESSEKTLIVDHSDNKQQNLQEFEQLPTIESSDTIVDDTQPSLGLGEIDSSINAIQDEVASQAISGDKQETGMEKTTVEGAKPNKQQQSPMKSENSTPSTTPSQQSSTLSPTKAESSDRSETDLPTSDLIEPVESHTSNYEQRMIKLEANCMKDMKDVLQKAESSIPQLDMSNPVGIQAWRDQLTLEVATAESTCDRNYQELIQSAKEDSVSANKIEEWTQTYDSLKVRLQNESRTKIQQLMGG